MLFNFFFHLIMDKLTIELYFLQSQKVANSGEKLHVGEVEGPAELLKLRTRSICEADLGDVGAFNSKKVEL